MEEMHSQFSLWFYLGGAAFIAGITMIILAKNAIKSKLMETGYFVLVLGLVGIISEWTDFSTILFIFTLVCAVVLGLAKIKKLPTKLEQGEVRHYIHYAREFFPVVLVVFILRAFLFEAYQIPSSSMRPDLTVGDFILVNKFAYGLREPITNNVFVPIHSVKRGDVVVFKDQQLRNRDLIKRVVAVGGDVVEYTNKRLIINGKPLQYSDVGTYTYQEKIPTQGVIVIENQEYIENLTGVKHPIIIWDKMPAFFPAQVQNFPHSENCAYNSDQSFKCTVPAHEYFMMGDNRDNSFDGRYWGFVPDQAVLGKAIYILTNFHDLTRTWTKISG